MPGLDRDDVLANMTGRFADFFQAYGPLRPDGAEMRGACVLHSGEGPNFTLDPETGHWYCHSRGCGKPGGDVFDFVMAADGLAFPEALERVAAYAGLSPDQRPVPRPSPRSAPKQAPPAPEGPFLDRAIAEELHRNLMDAPKVREWLSQHRGLTSETLRRFQIGLLPPPARGGQWRITFPVYDQRGRLTNIRKHLFAYKQGLDRTNKTLPWDKGLRPDLFPVDALEGTHDVLLVEGEPDAALACQMGFAAVTGTLGAENWKGHWTEALTGRRVTILYDGDEAGHRGAAKAAGEIAGAAASVCIARFPPGVKDFTEAVMGGMTEADMRRLVDEARPYEAAPESPTPNAAQKEEGEGWEPPVPFADAALPPFPLEALPPALAGFVSEVAASVQVPVDMAAMMALGVVAAAGARTCLLQVGETHQEPLNLFVAVVMEPGSRKSGTLDAMAAPLREVEREMTAAQLPRITEATEKRAVEEKRVAYLRDQAAKAKNGDEAAAMSREVADLAGSLTSVPVPLQLIIQDVTPEGAAKVAAEQGGTVAIVSAEGGLFGNLAGRYQNGQPNLDLFLHGHAGEEHRVNRKGSPPLFIARVCLTVLLAIQPGVLASLSETPAFGERGLVARFLFSIPEDLVGTRFYSNRRIAPAARAAYHAAIKSIAALPLAATEDDPGARHLLRLEGAALTLWAEYADDIERRQAEGGDLRPLKYWASKLAGAVARIAGGLHLAENAGRGTPWTRPISRATVAAAWAVGEYLIPHAQAAYGDMGEGPDAKTARRLLKWAQRRGRPEFTLRDCHQAHRSLPPTDLKAALLLLCERGFLRQSEEPRRGAAGRPKTPTYQVNPLLNPGSLHSTQNTQNTQN